MQKRTLFIIAGLGVLIALWAAFRPEKLFVNQKVNESFPSAAAASSPTGSSSLAPNALLTGTFHNGAHDTLGTASIYQGDGGKKILRLTNFKTSNGPDVHVYLVAAPDATDSDMVKKAGFIDLGSIKGNEGNQNYNIPEDANLSTHRAVTIWCARFNVNFGTAPIKESTMAMSETPKALEAGQFHKGAHDTSGVATIYELGEGKRVLRLTDFKTSNGPDVHVYLVAANDATDSDTVKKAGFIDLGSIKGNQGDQNY
ncbi:MAG: DM13 domain-containing protein, partial [Candidatus Acidiferrales bacterium]